MNNTPEIKPFGEHAFLINWSDEISPFNHEQVVALSQIIENKYADKIIEITPAYQSLAIYMKKNIKVAEFVQNIYQLLNQDLSKVQTTTRIIQIPVCYEAAFSLDLEKLSTYHKISKDSIVAHHTKPHYPVYFIGFLPGFPYMKGLNPIIATPRMKKPRSLVQAGSVGIAGNQTGIYPLDSPGGWNIIGRSPLSFFDVQKQAPSLLKIGDRVQFVAIGEDEYYDTQENIAQKKYKLQINLSND